MLAFTGARNISYEQQVVIFNMVQDTAHETWYVGDATGVDAFVREAANILNKNTVTFEAAGREPWQLVQRSKRMIDKFIQDGGRTLYAFPVQDCPKECYPGSTTWAGSGTWGTVAYAAKKDLNIVIFPLANLKFPEWYLNHQLPLF